MIKPLIFILFLLSIVATSCQEKQIDYPSLLKGDWATPYFENNRSQRILVFSFQDSTCSYLYPFGQFSKYRILGDTLIVDERARQRRNGVIEGKEKYKFRIEYIDENQLSISPSSDETKKLFRYIEGINSTPLILHRIHKKSDIQIKRIGFYSTSCYGRCPSMYLEIDSEGKMLYNGRAYTSKEGMHSGKISSNQLADIIEKIHNIELDRLNKNYAKLSTDQQTCGIRIQTNSTAYECMVYGFDKEPIELRLLFHYLMETYKSAELKLDSTANDKFVFKEFQNIGSKPPVPPSPINKK